MACLDPFAREVQFAGIGNIAGAILSENKSQSVVSLNGIGKRTSFEEYRVQSRGGKGIITMKTNEKTGKVIGALTVKEGDEIMLITVAGQMVRISVNGIREAGRNTQGVKLIELDANGIWTETESRT